MEGDDPLVTLCRARVGRLIGGKWRLDALIGVGGMAAVYMATHRNGSVAAVKLLHEEVALNEEVRERFLREAYIANKVGHPGTVKVLDDDADENGTPYLVMELLQGESIEGKAEKNGGRLPIAETLDIIDQTLAVLEAAHKHAIIHRDLKPENLFLPDRQLSGLKLLDVPYSKWVIPVGLGIGFAALCWLGFRELAARQARPFPIPGRATVK